MPGSLQQNLDNTSPKENWTNPQAGLETSEVDLYTAIYRRLLFTLVTFGFFYALVYLLIYVQSRLPQLIIATVFTLAFLIPAPLIYFLVIHGKITLAGVFVLLGMLFLFSSNELVWSGLTVYQLITGGIIILLVGRMILPHKTLVYFSIIVVYICSVLLINTFPPIERYNATQSVIINTFTLATNIFLVVLIALQLIQLLAQKTLRFRLLSIFIILVVATTIASSSATYVIGAYNSERYTGEQLETVASLKEAELNSWKDNSLGDLQTILPQPDAYPTWENLLLSQEVKPTESSYRNSYNLIKANFQRDLLRTNLFQEIFLMDANGLVVVSTSANQEGQDQSSWDYFKKGIQGSYINPPIQDPTTGQISIVFSVPVEDPIGGINGVLAGRVNMGMLNEITQSASGLVGVGECYLVQDTYTLLTTSKYSSFLPGSKNFSSSGIKSAIETKKNGTGSYQNYNGISVIGAYHWIPDLKMALIVEQDLAKVFSSNYSTLWVNWGVGLIALIGAIVAALVATRRITKPLDDLARISEQITEGNLGLSVEIPQEEEIGALAKSFNQMTVQLRELIFNLEERVADRTRKLEQRSNQLLVAADVARDTTAIYDQEELLTRAVNLIRDRLGYYHAGIFLVDENSDYAILKAATGEAGKAMLERGHHLKVGEVGIVGFVTSTGQSRAALNVNADPTYYRNPFLPETRSELALPLKAGGRVIGALDVQSTDENAFGEEDIRMLQTMADQLAVAIENARLFQEMGRTVQQLETAQEQYTKKAWTSFTQRSDQTLGYRYRGLGVEPSKSIPEEAKKALKEGHPTTLTAEGEDIDGLQKINTNLAVPIKLRDQVVGVVDIRITDSSISNETITFFEEIASRLALALESSRLLEETQLRSEQLRFLQEVTATAAAHIHLNDLLSNVSQKLLDGFNLLHCGIVLLNPDGKTGTLVASTSNIPDSTDILGVQIQVEGNEVTQEVIRDRKAVVIYDAQHNPRTSLVHDLMKQRGTNTLILAPLMSRGAVIGTIGLDVGDPQRRFNPDDLTLIDQICLQIAVAIEVSRLFEQTEQRAQRERTVGEITSRMRESLDVETVLKTAADEIRKSMGLRNVTIRLGVPKGN